MGRKKFNFKLIEQCLKEEEQGVSIEEICEREKISEQIFSDWKKRFQSATSAQFVVMNQQRSTIEELTSKIKGLEYDKKLLEARCVPFEDLLQKQALTAEDKKGYVDYLIGVYGFPKYLALDVIGLSRTGYTYERLPKDDVAVYDRLGELAKEFPGGSCSSFCKILKEEGRGWNHKRIERIYKIMGLNRPKKKV